MDNENQTAAGTTKKKVVHYFLSKSNESTLKTCANAWVPKCLRGKDANDSSADKDSQIEVNNNFFSLSNGIGRLTVVHVDYIIHFIVQFDTNNSYNNIFLCSTRKSGANCYRFSTRSLRKIWPSCRTALFLCRSKQTSI